MAIPIWDGSTDGNLSTGANWSTGSAPVTGDTVIFPKGATRNVTDGLGQFAVDLAELIVEKGCTINFGTAAGSMQYGIQAGGSITWEGTGTAYVEIAGDQTTTGVFNVRACTTLYIASYSTEKTVNTLNVTANSGSVYLAWNGDETGKVDTINKWGGSTLYMGSGVVATGGGAITALNSYAGSTHVRSSVVTLVVSGTVFPDEVMTVTNTTVYSTGTVDLRNGSGAVTFSNTVQTHTKCRWFDDFGRGGNTVFKNNGGNLQDRTIQLIADKTITLS